MIKTEMPISRIWAYGCYDLNRVPAYEHVYCHECREKLKCDDKYYFVFANRTNLQNQVCEECGRTFKDWEWVKI